MVESIYFLKPAWCGTHFAGLWPEQGLQPVTRATALRRWFVTPFPTLAIVDGRDGKVESVLRLRISHGSGINEPVGALQRRAVAEVEKQLKALGVAPR